VGNPPSTFRPPLCLIVCNMLFLTSRHSMCVVIVRILAPRASCLPLVIAYALKGSSFLYLRKTPCFRPSSLFQAVWFML
jgi:hypothetical protein